MTLFSIDNTLFLFYNKKGLFPYPSESEELFLKRCQKLDQAAINQNHLLAFEKVKNKFDIYPNWVEIIYHNKGLRFWEAAFVETNVDKAQMQLKTHFLDHERFLHFYHRDEIIAHECCHIVRLGFDSSKFEEILAYQFSPLLRKWLGPLFKTSLQGSILVLLVIASLLSDIFLFSHPLLWKIGKVLPIFYLFYLSIDVTKNYISFYRCQRKIKQMLIQSHLSLAVMLRLTDVEIELFGKSSEREIKEYIDNQLPTELRWQVIWQAYFKK